MTTRGQRATYTMTALILAALLAVATPLPAAAQEVHAFDVTTEDSAAAIRAFSAQAGLQILASADDLKGKTFNPVNGKIPTEQALTNLLAGTGLNHRYVGERAVALVSEAAAPGIDSKTPAAQQTLNTADASDTSSAKKPGFWDRFRLAQSESSSPSKSTSSQDDKSSRNSGGKPDLQELEEIVVTAQKRIERAQDVPVPVTAIDPASLVDSNRLRLQDYYASVPGLSLASSGHGEANLSIRGVTTGGLTNPTVGITVDDAPFGSTTALGSRTAAPDIDPADLARIEVLRGPQGTLYGANSMGGLLKFVTVDPSTAGFSGRVQVDLNDVRNGDSNGYGLRAAVNVPMSETFAVRASAFRRRDSGYIEGFYPDTDAPTLRAKGVNDADIQGGRLSALWRPSDAWSIKLSALFQDIDADGDSSATADPQVGDLQTILLLRTRGGYRHKLQSYTATVSADLGSTELIAISGYSQDTYSGIAPVPVFDPSMDFVFPGARTLAVQRNETEKFTQEIRLSGAMAQRADWLAGVFYTHEDTPTRDRYYGVDPATLERAGLALDDPYPTTYAEYAAFGDLTFHVTDRFDLQVGGRHSHNQQAYEEQLLGPLFGGDLIQPRVHSDDDSFTFLVAPSFKFSREFMVYARAASGYRPGGPNTLCQLFAVPCQYGPDKTLNYELGAKGSLWDGRLSFDASIYHVDWKDIQLQVQDPNTFGVFYVNASRARSQGVELAMEVRPMQGLRLSAWAAWSDATLRENLPGNNPGDAPGSNYIVGFSGDRLPFSSRFSGSVSAEQEFPLGASMTGILAASLSYVGDRKGNFPTPDLSRLEMPGYAQTNASAGIRRDSWSANLYVNNLTDRRGALFLNVFGPLTLVNYIQPRTIGLSLAKTF